MKVNKQGQTAIEYMILLAAVVAIVLVGFKMYLPRIQESSNIYFNRAAVGLYGAPPRCGDGNCASYEDCEKCPSDCGTC